MKQKQALYTGSGYSSLSTESVLETAINPIDGSNIHDVFIAEQRIADILDDLLVPNILF